MNANNAISNVLNYAGDHMFAQFQACFLACMAFGLQGNTVYLNFSGFSWSLFKEAKLSAFAGVELGINTATTSEMIHNNLQMGAGAGVPEKYSETGAGGGIGWGFGGGASGYEGPHGIESIRPYAYALLGSGVQFQGGPTWTPLHYTFP